jgi:hypothetical protein
MRRFAVALFICLLGINLSAFADVLPLAISDIPQSSVGVYQVSQKVVVHQKPSVESKIVFEREMNYSTLLGVKYDNNFGILIPQKELAYLYATDCDEDWVEVIYDKSQNLKGWVQKEDDFQFLAWITFYNMYGRKYGLVQLKNAPSVMNDIYSQPDDSSQLIGKITRPKQIRLTAIEGNWILVSILDVSYYTNTGYVQWRNSNGQYYYFPDIK